MATLNLGRIKPVFRGAYSGSTAYVVDDIVTHGDESFICIQAHGAGTQATSVTAYWTKLAAKGTDGTDVGTTITTQGDLLYRDGSGLQRRAKGTASQQLAMNSGATAPEWITASSGGILQVKNVQVLTSADFSSTSMEDVTGMAVAITPASTSNRLWINCNMNGQHSASSMNTAMRVYDSTNSAIAVGQGYDWYHPSGGGVSGGISMSGFYTPPNTSAMTFQVQVDQMAGSGTWKMNKDFGSIVNGQCSLTVMEIASGIL